MSRWWAQASCAGLGTKDGDPFFPDTDGGGVPTALCVMCFDCPVKLQCRLEGYAEGHGYWGNTSADWRTRTRRAIFRRMWPTQVLALDDHAELRYRVRQLVAKCGGDVISAMYRAGFVRAEVKLFADYTPLDRRAEAAIMRQERDRTSYGWRQAQRAPIGAQ